MGILKFIPIIWAVAWSIWAIRFVIKRDGQFKWGLRSRGGSAPLWFGRVLFIVGSAYALFWAIVTAGMDLGYWGRSSAAATWLEAVSQGAGTVLLDMLLAAGFMVLAVHSFKVALHREQPRTSRLVVLILTLVAVSVAGFFAYRLVGAIMMASSKMRS